MPESSLTASVRLSDEQQTELNRHKRAVRINNEKYFRCHPVLPRRQKRPPLVLAERGSCAAASGRARPACATKDEGPSHWAPSHCLGCAGYPPFPKPPSRLRLSTQELRSMVKGFMAALVEQKPADVPAFAREFFGDTELARRLGYDGWTRPATPVSEKSRA